MNAAALCLGARVRHRTLGCTGHITREALVSVGHGASERLVVTYEISVEPALESYSLTGGPHDIEVTHELWPVTGENLEVLP